MNPLMDREAEIDTAAARAIAVAMRQVAQADGDHPEELALIEAFEGDIPGSEEQPQLDALTTPGQKEALLKSMLLVAFADGEVSTEEQRVIRRIAGEVGLTDADLARATHDVAAALLGQLEGVTLFRAQVVALGRDMGLTEAEIDEALTT